MTTIKKVLQILSVVLILISCGAGSTDKEGKATQGATGPGGWLTVLNDAYAKSVKEKKPILAYFTASDTCGLCRQLESDIFSTSLFTSWSADNVVLFRVDLPANKNSPGGYEDQNAAMARSLKVTTFPALWMLSVTHEAENGRFKVKPMGYVEYQPSAERLIGSLQNFMRR